MSTFINREVLKYILTMNLRLSRPHLWLVLSSALGLVLDLGFGLVRVKARFNVTVTVKVFVINVGNGLLLRPVVVTLLRLYYKSK